MAARQLILDILARDRGAARTIERVGDAADDAGRSFDDLGDDAKRLDGDIDRVKGSMSALAAEMSRLDRGSNRFKELRKDFSALSKDAGQLGKLRKALGDVGADGAKELSLSFSQRIGPLLARAPVSPPLVGAIVAAAPAMGAAMSAAILAGLGTGAVAVGVAQAFKDSRVSAAGKAMAAELKDSLAQATQAFIPATLDAIGTLRSEIRVLGPDLERALAPAAGYIKPLVAGMTGFIRGVLPGLASGIQRAKPVIDALAVGLKFVGEQTGKALEAIGEGSSGAALALKDLMVIVGGSIRALGETIGFLSKAYAAFRLATSPDKAGVMAEMVQGEMQAQAFAATIGSLTSGMGAYRSSASEAANATDALRTAQNALNEASVAQFDNQTKLALAMREARDAAKGASGGINLNTEAGLKNRSALSQLAATIHETTQKEIELGGATSKVTEMQQQGYAAFIQTARGMGLSKSQASALARELKILPPSKRIPVSTPGAASSQGTVAALRAELAALRNRTIYVTTFYTSKGSRATMGNPGSSYGRGFLERAGGGPVWPNQTFLVGEKGPELVQFSGKGTVLPADKTRQAMSASRSWPAATSGGGRASGGARAGTGGGGVMRIEVTGEREMATMLRMMIRKYQILPGT